MIIKEESILEINKVSCAYIHRIENFITAYLSLLRMINTYGILYVNKCLNNYLCANAQCIYLFKRIDIDVINNKVTA